MGCDRVALFSFSLIAFAFLDAQGMLAAAEDRGQTPPRVHELTPEKNGHVIKVRPGDEVILRLPMQMPFQWGLTGKPVALRAIKVPLRLRPVNEGNPQGQVVGSPQVFEARYRVVAPSKDETVEWVDCYLGRTNEGGVPVKPTEPLQPKELPTKKGTYFRVRLTNAD